MSHQLRICTGAKSEADIFLFTRWQTMARTFATRRSSLRTVRVRESAKQSQTITMKIPAFDDFKRAVAMSTHAQATKRSARQGSRSVWPLALACGFLIFVTGSSIYLVVSAQAAGELVNNTLQIETKLFIMLSNVRSAESGQRGYLLTGDPKYLDTYRTGITATAPIIAELKGEITDPAQQKALAGLEPLIERKFAELGETIRLYDAGQSAESLALVRSGVGLNLMTEIRAMTEEEHRLFSLQASNSALTNGWLLGIDLIGLILIIVLAVISILVMRRSVEKERAYVGELERSNQELDDFAYIASHDLKEPLRGLFNHASFLLEDYKHKIDDDGVRRLNRLGQLCQRMERLINDLMYFSRLGRADLAVQETDPNAVIVEIEQMMESVLSERHARIVVPRALPQIVCDKIRVTEVFRNLITNAVKYNDKTERVVEIGFLGSVNTKERLERNVFYVRDNGVGIDPEFHQEIFRIFKRLQNASDGQEAGTGVGLTFVKKIVERHGGRIWLESESGKGTVFYFSLNCGRNEPARNAHENAIDPVPVHSAG
jgi:signal transduction histidine kinase